MKKLFITFWTLFILVAFAHAALATDCTNPKTGQVIRVPNDQTCPFGYY